MTVGLVYGAICVAAAAGYVAGSLDTKQRYQVVDVPIFYTETLEDGTAVFQGQINETEE